MTNRHFHLQDIDSHRNSGGSKFSTAPEPFALFLASIGTCAGIFVLLFCQSRGVPADYIRLVQTHYDRDTGHGIGKIDIAIGLPAGAPEKYKDADFNAANSCSVKRHIHEPPEVHCSSCHPRLSENSAKTFRVAEGSDIAIGAFDP